MRIEFRPDPALDEPIIIIRAREETETIRRLIMRLDEHAVVNGYDETGITLLREEDIVCVYSERQKIFAETASGRFAVRERLYELEQRLDPALFIRVSSGELVNSRHIVRLDAAFTGTIRLHLDNGRMTCASRRQVKALKTHFGL